MKTRIICSLLGTMPVLLMGFSTGPPPRRTGAAVDGGTNCTACHRTFAPANSDSRGSVLIDVANYVPGVKQTIKVTVMHPDAARWGFELTARMVSDETKTAGELAPNSVVRVICDDGSARGSLAPCQPGQLSFAEHLDAPRTAPGAGFTFTVDWTPPATDVGDIVFYAAGNAANGDGSPNGDRIYTTVRRISPPCNLTQKPSIGSMVNSASFRPPWSNGVLATIFGSNFGPAGNKREVTAGDIVSQRFPQSLSCIAVTVNGQQAPLLYVQPDQINLQIPTLGTLGAASVVVIANPGAANELRSDPLTVNTQQAYSPAFFVPDGKHIAAIMPNGAASAKAGDVVSLFGTGMGQTDPVVSPGDIPQAAAQITGPLSVTVGGISIPLQDIVYVGVSPGSICGLQQVNVKLPANLPEGDVPVTITVGGQSSQPGAVISVSR